MTDQSRLTFIALNVGDVAQSVHFYKELLALPLHESVHGEDDLWTGGAHAAYSWVEGAFLHFALYPARLPDRPVTNSLQVGFHVDNFDELHQGLVAAGIPILQDPRSEPWGRTARYSDPDGNIVSITERSSGD